MTTRLDAIIDRARRLGRIDRLPEAAADATELESRHAARSYVARAGYERFHRLRRPQLTTACDVASHPFAAAVVTGGPGRDSPQFDEAWPPRTDLCWPLTRRRSGMKRLRPRQLLGRRWQVEIASSQL